MIDIELTKRIEENLLKGKSIGKISLSLKEIENKDIIPKINKIEEDIRRLIENDK